MNPSAPAYLPANSNSQPAPEERAAVARWDPKKTVVAAVVSFALSTACFVGILSFSSYLMQKSSACSELASLLCTVVILVVTAAIRIISAFVVAYLLLRRKRVRCAAAIAVSGTAASLLGVVSLNIHFAWSSWLSLAATAVLTVLAFVFYDWLYNVSSLKLWWKVILALALLIALLASDYRATSTTVGQTAGNAGALESSLKASPFTILAPGPASGAVQPISIADNGSGGSPYYLDFSKGATIDLAGDGQSLTLYEFKYTGGTDPVRSCQSLYDAADLAELAPAECTLATTMPSGTKIYADSGGLGKFFVVSHGTIAFLTGTGDDALLDKVLDRLQPIPAGVLMQTLHRQNPEVY